MKAGSMTSHDSPTMAGTDVLRFRPMSGSSCFIESRLFIGLHGGAIGSFTVEQWPSWPNTRNCEHREGGSVPPSRSSICFRKQR